MIESKRRFVRSNEAEFPPRELGGTHCRTFPPAADGSVHKIYVSLPYSYDENPERSYPVLYICDGFWDFVSIVGFYGNLLYDEVIPEFILIGLAYEGDAQGSNPELHAWRERDYCPPPPGVSREGRPLDRERADEYLNYLQEVIMPFAESEYAIDTSHRVLGGCSSGGLFALYTMFRNPELFRSYIVIGPTVNHLKRRIFEYEKLFFETGPGLKWLVGRRPRLPCRLFLASAEEEDSELFAGIETLNSVMDSRRYRGFRKSYRVIPEERHGGSKAAGYSRGIRFAFSR